jgi:hypothetical protein
VCGGAVAIFASAEDPFIEALTIDEGFVYWVSSSSGTLNRIPKTGGALEVLAKDQIHPLRLAVAGEYVYWLSGTSDPGSEVGMPAVLSRMLKSGSEPEALAESSVSVYRFSDVIVDGGFVYWVGVVAGSPLRILRVPQAGGPVESLGDFGPREEPLQFALHAGSVYVLASRRTETDRLVSRLERHAFGSLVPAVLVDGINAGPTSRMVANDGTIFFTGGRPATLMRVDPLGQNLAPVVEGVAVWNFALAGDVIYAVSPFELLLIDVAAASFESVGGLGAAVRFEGSIAVDAASVFFANSLGIWRFSRVR